MEITYQLIESDNQSALQLPNEPFTIFGRMVVSRSEDQWHYTSEKFSDRTTQTFPTEDYLYEDVAEKGFALGAFLGEECLGLAIFQKDWAKYYYLHDLKVKQAYRRQGVAAELIRKGLMIAQSQGYAGVYTIAQDNNLAACQFYLQQGFVIGGLNTHVYNHTQQAGKADIYFYLDGAAK